MVHQITLDMDKECSCGVKGVTESGRCLHCTAAKIIEILMDGDKGYTKPDTERLMTKLSDAESEAYGKELASVIVDKGKLECARANINKQIKPLVERLDELAPIVDAGEEMREIECRWYYDFANKERFLVRLDTMELVKSDIIPLHELQQSLELQRGE